MKVFFFLQNEKFEVILLVILLFSANTNGSLLPNNSFSTHEFHLMSCLTYISQRYFATRRSLVISSPASYRDVQQELIAEIHRTSIWPVVVTVDGNISKSNTTNFIDRDGNYIILTPDGNIKSLMGEINGLVRDGKYKMTKSWNSETRVVVAGANEFSLSQQTDIFDYFSQLKIYNCIIVSQEHYVIDKEYSRPIKVNDVNTGMKLGVYTWFPYQSSERCAEVNDITQLDSWVVSAQGHFTKNTDLFPVKISNSLNGCPMKAFVRDTENDLITNYVQFNDSEGDVRIHIAGLEMDLLRVVLQQMNMTFVHVPTPDGFEWGNGLLLFNAMIEKETYMAVGGLSLNYGFGLRFDITSSYHFTSIRWYVPCFVKNPRWSSIFRILSVELWLVLIISIVIAAISITLVGLYSCTSEWQVYKTLSSSLTNVWAVILGVSVSTMPRTPSLRLLFLAWVCFSVAFSTVFQAFLTTFLIDPGYKTPIQNMDELFESRIRLYYQPGYNFIFENVDETAASKVRRNKVNCPWLGDCVNRAKYENDVSIFLPDMDAEKYYASGDFVGENSEPFLCKLEDGVFLHTGQTMLMFHGDPLMRRVIEIIDRVVEADLYNHWISLNMHRLKLYSGKIALVHPLDGYYSFNLYYMQSAFYLLLMGWCLSVLCFMVELLYNRLLNK